MTQNKSDTIRVALKGAFMSVLLIISFLLPRIWEGNPTVSSFNTLLIVAILLIAANVVRATASLFSKSKAKLAAFSALMLLPVFNIAVACVQFVFADAVNPTAEWFTVLLVLFSLPVFCGLYFTLICIFHKKDRRFFALTAVLDAICILYVIVRLADKVIVASDAGGILSVISPWFSFVIYLLSLVFFIICIKVCGGTDENSDE